jgi:Tfp pilus assembly protein PilF
LRKGKSPLFLGPRADVRGVSLSPDGQYAATGTHNGDSGVTIWNTETGQEIVRFPVGGMSHGVFSPDGKWLGIRGTHGRRLVKVGTWEERPLIAGVPFLFTPDSSLLVAVDESGVIRLLTPDALREVARLEDPNQDHPGYLAFTADGSKLLVSSDDGRALHVWDLRCIRSALAEIGLDWDLPPLPPALPNSSEPLQLHLDMGDFRQLSQASSLVRLANERVQAHKHAEGLKMLREAVRLAPRHAMAHNNLAWLLLTAPRELRNSAEALTEARTAVELEPHSAIYRNTLGVALYRGEKFADAAAELEYSLRESHGQTDAFDLYFLAMCHHNLGDAAKAKDCFARGEDWFAKRKNRMNPLWMEELTAFQAEANALMAQTAKRNSSAMKAKKQD